MSKIFKIIFITFIILAVITFLGIWIIFVIPPKTKFDENLLNPSNNSIIIFDKNNREITTSAIEFNKVDGNSIPKYTKNAFIAIEDKNFYNHGGVDFKRIFGAILKNVKSRSYSQGASTISQQLIKNTHLSREKKLSRKIDEIKLAKILEKNFSKDEILNMYLNTIYFGENAYGINNASNVYFSKNASELNLNESATLAAIIVAPSKLNPKINLSECKKRRNLVLTKMREQNYISSETEISTKNEDIILNFNENYDTDKSYVQSVLSELKILQQQRPYTYNNCKIHTIFDGDLQDVLINSKPDVDTDYQAMILDNRTRQVIAYYSTCGQINRSPASTAKPYISYAPAIEEGLINELTVINDEKTDFNGYCPKNYKDRYYNNISAKKALAVSSNVASVKVLNTVGIEKAKNYAKQLGIQINANNLGIALGAFDSDVPLIQTVGAYSTFANLGLYKKPRFISYIEDFKGNVIYKNDAVEKRVFSQGTSSIICDMLDETVLSGTSKSLRNLGFKVYSKTGTNGFADGNLDAYNVSFTGEHTFAVWLGNKDNKLMDNSITGSNQPTLSVKDILKSTYKDKKPKNIEYKDVVYLTLDKKSYENKGEILLATDNTPKKYTINAFFTVNNQPTNYSTNFETPKISDFNLSFINNVVNINYKVNEFTLVEIYKNDKLIYQGNKPYKELLNDKKEYEYSIIPYIESENGKIYGEKIILGKINDKTKSQIPTIPKDWWKE